MKVFLGQVAVSLDNIVPIQRELVVFTHDIKLLRESLVVRHDVVGVDECHISGPIAKALQRPCKAVIRFLV